MSGLVAQIMIEDSRQVCDETYGHVLRIISSSDLDDYDLIEVPPNRTVVYPEAYPCLDYLKHFCISAAQNIAYLIV